MLAHSQTEFRRPEASGLWFGSISLLQRLCCHAVNGVSSKEMPLTTRGQPAGPVGSHLRLVKSPRLCAAPFML